MLDEDERRQLGVELGRTIYTIMQAIATIDDIEVSRVVDHFFEVFYSSDVDDFIDNCFN